MSEWIFNLVMAPLNWAVTETIVFAVTAPIEHIYIAMSIAAVLAMVLIWSMIPKKSKSHNIEYTPVVYQATDEDEKEAKKILAGAQAI